MQFKNFQGFNSGVAIYHLGHMRQSRVLPEVLDPKYFEYLSNKYFVGGLGDQVGTRPYLTGHHVDQVPTGWPVIHNRVVLVPCKTTFTFYKVS